MRGDKSVKTEIETTGIWVATEDIAIASVLGNDIISGLNQNIDEISEYFEDILKKQGGEHSKVIKELFNFLSLEFSRKAEGYSNNYKITSAFTNYIFDNIKQAEGVLYPSTLYPSMGLNLALKNETVDNKLKFLCATRRKLEEIENRGYINIEQNFSKINVDDDKNIDWDNKEISDHINNFLKYS